MAAQNRRSKTRRSSWPVKAIGLFIVILLLVWGVVLFTGNRSTAPKLGIDLQGGTRVTLVPQGGEPTKEQLDQARQILENRVNGMGVSGAEVVADGNTLVITVPGEDTQQARALGQTSQLLFRPVTQPKMPDLGRLSKTMGDTANRWVAKGVLKPEEANDKVKKFADDLNKVAEQSGQPQPQKFEAPKITATPPAPAKNSIEAADRRQQVTDMLKKDRQTDDPTQQMAAMQLLVCDGSVDPLAGSDDPAKPLVTCSPEEHKPYVLQPAPLLDGHEKDPKGPRLTGSEIDNGRPIQGGINQQTGQMEISFAFKNGEGEPGGSTWQRVTTENMGNQVAITLDSQIISAPVIKGVSTAGQSTAITGKFSQAEATQLANNLRYGALPLSFAGENGERGGTTTTIPATLGVASLKAGLIAGAVGLLLVALFALAYYRMLGFLAIASLVASGALVYGSLVVLGRLIGYSLDLAGVAGLIIGIGTTADSFVVLYERIKDEVRDGRTFRSAVPRGWDRAKLTIVSGNFVSLIAAVVLYVLAVGEVKGFAFTLGLTTIFDLVITFLFTAPLVILASRKPFWSKPAVNGMGKVYQVAEAHKHREAAGVAESGAEREATGRRPGVARVDADGAGARKLGAEGAERGVDTPAARSSEPNPGATAADDEPAPAPDTEKEN